MCGLPQRGARAQPVVGAATAAPAILWIGASGVGCLDAPDPAATPDGTGGCAAIILALSLPLSLLAIVMLRGPARCARR